MTNKLNTTDCHNFKKITNLVSPSTAMIMAVVVVSEFIKEHKEMNGQLYWGQPQVIHLDYIVEPYVTISFSLHSTKYFADIISNSHAQFIQMITCHLTCVWKMKKNRKVVVNNAFDFENLFDNNSEGQTLDAAPPPADNMEGDYEIGSYNGYNYVD